MFVNIVLDQALMRLESYLVCAPKHREEILHAMTFAITLLVEAASTSSSKSQSSFFSACDAYVGVDVRSSSRIIFPSSRLSPYTSLLSLWSPLLFEPAAFLFHVPSHHQAILNFDFTSMGGRIALVFVHSQCLHTNGNNVKIKPWMMPSY